MSIEYKDEIGVLHHTEKIITGENESIGIFFKSKSGKKWKILDKDKDNTLKYPDKNADEETKSSLEEKFMLDYARENGLTPVGLPVMLQGELIERSDYIKLTNEDLLKKVNEYFSLIEDINSLVSEREQEIKDTKDKYKEYITDKKEQLDIVTPIAKTGLVEERVECSWERLPETKKMALVKRDDLKPLAVRDMTGEEKTKNDLFDGGGIDVMGEDFVPDDTVDQNYGIDGDMCDQE